MDKRLVGAYTPREPFEDTECPGSKDGMSSKKRKQRNFSLTIGTDIFTVQAVQKIDTLVLEEESFCW